MSPSDYSLSATTQARWSPSPLTLPLDFVLEQISGALSPIHQPEGRARSRRQARIVLHAAGLAGSCGAAPVVLTGVCVALPCSDNHPADCSLLLLVRCVTSQVGAWF